MMNPNFLTKINENVYFFEGIKLCNPMFMYVTYFVTIFHSFTPGFSDIFAFKNQF